ncbi:MAG: hypothetical protein JWP80_4219 [Pseudomonas sp.]|nr:hypothetical protein [Pseudomonas sp.]
MMTVTVKERTEDHMSHDALNASVQMWDVLQGEILVGVYHSEEEALKYKALLESGQLDQLKASPNW